MLRYHILILCLIEVLFIGDSLWANSPPCPGFQVVVSTISPPLCTGDSNAAVTLTHNGGTAPFSYSLDGVTFGPSGIFTNLPAGVYTAYARDGLNCESSLVFSINDPNPVDIVVLSQGDVDCGGATSGFINVNGTGGTGVFTYSIDQINFQASGSFSGLAAGNYIITARDGNGCEDTLQITITEPPPLQLSIIRQEDVACPGDSTGILVLAGSGGSTPYQYSLDGISYLPQDSFPNLPAGTYQVAVEDANGCIRSDTIVLNQPPPILLGLTNQKDVSCHGGSDGSATFAATGGNPGYLWSSDGINFSPGPVFNGLSAGNFTITIQDAQGCQESTTVSIAQPPPLVLSLTQTVEIDCHGSNSGAVTFSASGGVPGYQFGEIGQPLQPNPGFTGLPAGNYEFVVADTNGCQDTLSLVLNEPPPLNLVADSVADALCTGTATGFVQVSANGGTAPYEFGLTSTGFGPSGSFGNLGAGVVKVFIRDNFDCLDSLEVTIGEPPPLTISPLVLDSISCTGNSDARVSAMASGGTAPYTYTWSPGQLVSDTLSGLGPGNYSVTVRDSNGCTAAGSVRIDPLPPVNTVINVLQEINCWGDSSGAAEVLISGGQGPYNYIWSTGQISGNQVFQLPAGQHWVQITDSTGCVFSDTLSMTEPPPLALSPGIQEVSCFGAFDGRLWVDVSGGTSPYSIQWQVPGLPLADTLSSLGAGTYRVLVSDSLGCQDSLQIVLNQPSALEILVATSPVLCQGDSNGRAEVQGQGGTLPYSWQWSTGDTTAQISDLPKGNYNVTMIDAQGCQTEAVVSIAEPSKLILNLVDRQDAWCAESNASALVIASGGTSPYTYSWNSQPSQNSDLLTGVPGNLDYQAWVADSNGCQDSLLVFLGDSGRPTAAFQTEPDLNQPVSFPTPPITFLNQSSAAFSWKWSFGDGSALSTEKSPLHQFTRPGEYQIILVAFDQRLACPDTATLTINLVRELLFVPNAFSPNGDGQNDAFTFEGAGLAEWELAIFDRWGRLIIRISAGSEGWNGEDPQGNPAPEGVYGYRLRARLITGRELEQTGSITLIR